MTPLFSTSTDLDACRQQFPALTTKTYFNYGGQGPMPRVAMDAIVQAQEHIQTIGPFSTAVNTWVQQEIAQTRAVIAQELHVPTDTITLTENVTAGCNIALWGIDWQVGDHLLLSDCEHPGIVAAVQELQRRFQLEVSTFPLLDTLNQGNITEMVTRHLQPNTRLVVISHVLWNTGHVLPLKEIVTACHDRGAQILVDAAQSVGMMPLDLSDTGVDFYAFTGHKWWCGAAGLGGLYVRPGVTLHPTFIGWRGIRMNASGDPIGWKADGQRFEVATSDYTLLSGLRAAIAFHHQWGSQDDRYRRICQLSAYLWENLGKLPNLRRLCTTPPQSGLVSFQIVNVADAPTAHQHLVKSLESTNTMTRILLSPNCVRACVHYFSLEAEIDTLIAQIQAEILDGHGLTVSK